VTGIAFRTKVATVPGGAGPVRRPGVRRSLALAALMPIPTKFDGDLAAIDDLRRRRDDLFEDAATCRAR
jgi:hypothetical protein